MTFEINGLCDVDQSISNKLLSAIDMQHWTINESRQKRFKAHRFTKTILLRHTKDFAFNNFKFVNYEMFEYYKSFTDKYLEAISPHFEIKDYTALIVKLRPSSVIGTHVDGGSRFFQLGHRLHIPVKTNDKVFFDVGSTRTNMKVGKIYEINNLAPHRVENQSKESRIHLIMDIFDKSIEEYPEYWMN